MLPAAQSALPILCHPLVLLSEPLAIARLTSMEMPELPLALLVLTMVTLLLSHQQLPLSLLSAHAPPTPTEPMPVSDAPLALTILSPLVELSPLPRLLAIAWLTSMEMLKPVHALLAIMAVPLLLRHPPLPLSLLSAHAPPTPMEPMPMPDVPTALTILLLLFMITLVKLPTLVLERLPRLLAIA